MGVSRAAPLVGFWIGIIVLTHWPSAAPAQEAALADRIRAASSSLATIFEAGEADQFREMLEATDDPDAAAIVGQMLFMRRHFGRAAWFFAQEALRRSERPESLNNFAVALEETYLADPENRPAEWASTAAEVLEQAAIQAPDDAFVQNNLGRSLLTAHQAGDEDASLDAAAEAGRRAVALDDDEVLFYANLARILTAAGDPEGAAEALANAHRLSSADPAYLIAAGTVRGNEAANSAYQTRPRPYCQVNFQCLQRCPASIIGRIKVINCEIAQQDALLACQAGQPYARGYACAEEIPDFGILIPGLNAGFSINTPWGGFHVTMDGAGNVQWRAEFGPSMGPVSAYVRADGTYQPSGGHTITDTRTGVRFNLFNRNAAAREAGSAGIPPARIQMEGQTGGNVEISGQAYGASVIAH